MQVSILPLRLFGDPVLRERAEPVTTFDKELHQLVDDLKETMLASGGAGLAAPQLGVSLRVFALHPDLSEEKLDHLINPVLAFPDEVDQDGREGCLSAPGIYLDTKRRMNVVAKGLSKHGDPVQIVGNGLLARCIQHETDHLDGILFVDRRDTLRQDGLLAAIMAADWYNERLTVKVSPH